MYKDEEVKRMYFKKRYEQNKDSYKQQREAYWVRYAKKKLNKEDVTEEEVKECRNAYYREYRKAHPKETKEIIENFWNKQSEMLEQN